MANRVYVVEWVSVSWKEMFAGDLTKPKQTRRYAHGQEGKQAVTHAHANARKTQREITISQSSYFATIDAHKRRHK